MSSSFYGHSKNPLNNFDDGSRYAPNPMDGRGMPPRNHGGPDLRLLNNRPTSLEPRQFLDQHRPQMDRSFQSVPVRGFESSNDGRMMDHHRQLSSMGAGPPQHDLRSNQPQQSRFPFPTTTILPLNQANGLNPLVGGQSSLAPPKQLTQQPMLLQQFQRPSVTERVQVPPELASFAAEPKFQQILLRVKEQTNVNYISVNRVADNVVESVAIDAASKESAELAKNLIETHLKLQMKIKAAENRLQKVQTDLFSTQGEIAAGHVVECSLSPDLIGLAIGKKGARIKQIETETGVSSINVADSGKITIYGPDAQSVQKAREQLELVEDSCPVTDRQADWFSDKMNASYLVDLRTSSNLMVAKLNREELRLDIVGTIPAVQMAKCLWSTQLEYVDRQIEIEEDERQVREQLQAVRKQYGFQNSRSKTSSNKSTGSQQGHESQSSSNKTNGAQSVNNYNGSGKNDKIEASSKVSAAPNGGFFNANNDRGRKGAETTVASELNAGKTSNSVDHHKSLENALDALITYTPQEEKVSGRGKKQSKDQKAVAEKITTETDGRDNKFNKKNDKQDNKDKGQKNDNKNGRTVVEVRFEAMESKPASDKSKKGKISSKSDSNTDFIEISVADKADQKGNNKDKGKPSKSSGQSTANLPPPPTLSLPPTPPVEGKTEAISKKKSNNIDKKSHSENKSDGDKQPMLVKINNPFLEQKNAKKAPELEIIPPQSDSPTPSPKVFGPPKEPPKNVTAKKSEDGPAKKVEDAAAKKSDDPIGKSNKTQSNDKKEANSSASKEHSSGKGNSRHKDRNSKKEHHDLLNKVEILSVVTVDQQLVANLSAMKMDVVTNKTNNSDQDAGEKAVGKKINNNSNKKKGKSADDSSPQTETQVSADGQPLPKRNNARKSKDSPTSSESTPNDNLQKEPVNENETGNN